LTAYLVIPQNKKRNFAVTPTPEYLGMKKQALPIAICICICIVAFTPTYANQQSSYIGLEAHDIKALSQQEIAR
jgi:hypothetical protein